MSDSKVDTSHTPVEDLSEKLIDARSPFMIHVRINDETHFVSGPIDPRRIIHVLTVSQVVHTADGVEYFSQDSHVKTTGVVFSDLIFDAPCTTSAYERGHAVIDGFEELGKGRVMGVGPTEGIIMIIGKG